MKTIFIRFNTFCLILFSLSGCLNPTFNDQQLAAGGEAPDPTTVCSGTIINGVTGTANCSGGASPATVCSGTTINGVAGTAFCSTASALLPSNVGGGDEDNDAVTMRTNTAADSASWTSVVIDMGSDFIKSNICSGKTIFGRLGTAVCNSVFGDLTASNMHRDVATAQMNLTTEKSTSSYPRGYREVPDVTKDDESSQALRASRPTATCGTTQTSVALRISDCSSLNVAAATWIGSEKGVSGEATWKLVTRTAGAKEVWRDERTGLVWSDVVANSTWCRATGNRQTDAQDGNGQGICDPAESGNLGGQDASPTSYCSEAAGLSPASGVENWTTGVYDGAKGGMGAVSTGTSPSVRWRAPTLKDALQAEIDGLSFVLPNAWGAFWTATINSNTHNFAWVNFGYGYVDVGNLLSYPGFGVRCVGR